MGSVVIGIAALLVGDLGPRTVHTVNRSLETDWKMMQGKWVLKNPPAGWDRVELKFSIEGNLCRQESIAQNNWTNPHHICTVWLRERKGRRYIDSGGHRVEYTLSDGKLIIREPLPLRVYGSVSNGPNQLALPTLNGEWTRQR